MLEDSFVSFWHTLVFSHCNSWLGERLKAKLENPVVTEIRRVIEAGVGVGEEWGKKKKPTSGCGSLKWFAGGHGNTTEAGEDPGAWERG